MNFFDHYWYRLQFYLLLSKTQIWICLVLLGLYLTVATLYFWIKNYQPLWYEKTVTTDFVYPLLKKQQEPIYFTFDPNSISIDSMELLGFSTQQIQTWLKYREKYKFSSAEDFRKLWWMNDSLMLVFSSYLIFPDMQTKNSVLVEAEQKPVIRTGQKNEFYSTKKIEKKSNFSSILNLDLNQAKAEDWEKIRGIGTVLSKRIIQYREKLGGFYTADQLKEIKGISDSLFESFATLNFTVNPKEIRKINLNTADFKTLITHPYLDETLTKIILNMRKQRGNFQDIVEIRDLKLMNDSIYQKLEPYLDIK